MDPRQIENRSDLAHQVIVRHHLVEPKRIEKLLLVSVELPHHRPTPPVITLSTVNHGSPITSTDFCNKIGHKRTSPSQPSRFDATSASAKPATRL